jgi:hypothetical protein
MAKAPAATCSACPEGTQLKRTFVGFQRCTKCGLTHKLTGGYKWFYLIVGGLGAFGFGSIILNPRPDREPPNLLAIGFWVALPLGVATRSALLPKPD